MIFYLTVCKPLSILTGHILLHILFALHYLTALPILANGPLLKIYLAINLLTPRNFFIKMFSPLSYSQSEIALNPTPSFFPPPPPSPPPHSTWGGTLRDKTKTAARETRSVNDGQKEQNRSSGLIWQESDHFWNHILSLFFIFTRSDLDHQNRTFLTWFRDPSTRKRVTKNGVSKMSAFLWARP